MIYHPRRTAAYDILGSFLRMESQRHCLHHVGGTGATRIKHMTYYRRLRIPSYRGVEKV